MSYHLIPVRMSIIKSIQITSAKQYIEKRELFHTVGRNVG